MKINTSYPEEANTPYWKYRHSAGVLNYILHVLIVSSEVVVYQQYITDSCLCSQIHRYVVLEFTGGMSGTPRARCVRYTDLVNVGREHLLWGLARDCRAIQTMTWRCIDVLQIQQSTTCFTGGTEKLLVYVTVQDD
ncbi:hypothetical protein Tco_1483977 [Tanacetum coccineum]